MNGKNIENRAMEFAVTIIKITNKFPKITANFIIIRQIIRSVTSIGANLTEGSAAASRKEFINYLAIAKKSAVETNFWLTLIKKLSIISELETQKLLNECEEIIKIISKIILNTKNNTKL